MARLWLLIGFMSLQLLVATHLASSASVEDHESADPEAAASDPVADLQQQFASFREETIQHSKKDLELEKRLNALEGENLELKQILTKIASVANKDSSNATKQAGLLSSEPPAKIELTMTATGGVNYVRWGRTTCEEDATVIYTGIAASGGPTTGGTSDMVCLHMNPEVGNTFAAGTVYSQLNIVEYEFANAPFEITNNYRQNLANNDMPCAVCHVSTRTNQFMIPGRRTCPSGWVEEYVGYLVSTRYNSYKGAMVCLDEAPEAKTGGLTNDPNALPIHPVEIKCGASTICPPYKADDELTCAVCSK